MHQGRGRRPCWSGLYATEAVERDCVEDPVDDVEEDERHREHPSRDFVHLARLLSSVGVEVARRLSAISAILEHINLPHECTS